MRKLVTIRKIGEIVPIEEADRIEIAVVDGWRVIVKKGEFQPNDLCLFFEIDSFLPLHEEFEFLRKSSYKKLEDGTEGFRLKSQKLRGILSQGLALPTSILKEFPAAKLNTNLFLGDTVCINEKTVGDLDISNYLGVTLYEPPVSIIMGGRVRGSFPVFIPKTDEERIQNIPRLLVDMQGIPFYSTEKLDGCSFSAYKVDTRFGICSRNLELEYDPAVLYCKIADKYELSKKLEILRLNIALQGEIVGPGLAKNYYKLPDHELFLFSIYDIDARKYFSYAKFKIIASMLHLKTVPIVHENIYLPNTIQEILEMANGKSSLNPLVAREGLVFRPLEEISHPRFGRVSFKVLSNSHLLVAE